MTERASTPSSAVMWRLVPGWTRYRDEKDGSNLLRALVDALGVGIDAVRDDVRRLLDDMFVEWCDERMIPLIGDLVGVTIDPLIPVARQRHQVKYALHLRRRKGTVEHLEALGWQISGFRTRVYEAPSAQRTVRDPGFAARVSSPLPGEHPPSPGPRVATAADISGRIPVGKLRVELEVARPVRRTQVELVRLYSDVHAVPGGRAVSLRRPDGTPITLRDQAVELVGPGLPVEVTPVGADLAWLGRLVPRFMRLAGDAPVHVPDHTLAVDPELGRVAGPTAPMSGIRAFRRFRLSFFEPLLAEPMFHAPMPLGGGLFAFSPDGRLDGLTDAGGIRLRLALEGERDLPEPTESERLLVVREHGRGHHPMHHAPYVLLPPGARLERGVPADRQPGALELDGPGLNRFFSIEDGLGWDLFRTVRLVEAPGREPPADDTVEVELDRGRFRVGPAHERAALRVRWYRPFDVERIKRRAVGALEGALPLGRSATFVFRDAAPGRTEVISP